MTKFKLLRHTRITFSITLLLIPIAFTSTIAVSAESEKRVLAGPIEKYDSNIQAMAKELIQPGWLTNRRFNTARKRLQDWDKLAKNCDALDDIDGFFDVAACDRFAFSYKATRRDVYRNNCEKILKWKGNRIDELNSNLSEEGQTEGNLSIVTEAAIAQLHFEVERICDIDQDGFDGEYSHFEELAFGTGRLSTIYVMQKIQSIDSRAQMPRNNVQSTNSLGDVGAFSSGADSSTGGDGGN